jgi:hypothetical protein
LDAREELLEPNGGTRQLHKNELDRARRPYQVAEKLWCRLLKKIQRRGAQKNDKLRRTHSTSQRGDLSATKDMGLFSTRYAI